MATSALVPVEEYLRTCYDPDREYIDGVVLERNLGQQEHSLSQINLASLLWVNKETWSIRPLTEQRVQVKPHRFRIPDVCILRASEPWEQIITRPPLLCAEILSEDDRIADLQSKLDDYYEFGVPCVWVIDPQTRRAWLHTPHASQEATGGILRVPGTQIAVPIAEIFAGLP
jgi:Uma2 family endonuclease